MPAPHRPRTTVLVPMRDAERFVADTIRSLLSQTASDLEVVVVDDGSRDASRAQVEAVADDRVRIVEGPSRGIAAALNRGLEEARGDVLMRCDSDDEFRADRVARQLALLDAHDDVAAVCSAYEVLNPSGQPVLSLPPEVPGTDVTDTMKAGVVPTHTSTFALRTEQVRRLGGARGFFETAEDVDLVLRAGTLGRVLIDPEPLHRVRLHDDSVTHSARRDRLVYYDAVARQLLRERLAHGADALDRGDTPAAPERAPGASEPARRRGARPHIQHLLLGEAWRLHRRGRRAEAVAQGLRALSYGPRDPKVWRSVAALAVKRHGPGSRSASPARGQPRAR